MEGDGRGLVSSRTPLRQASTLTSPLPETALAESYSYTPNGRPATTTRPTQASVSNVYDGLDRVAEARRISGPAGGSLLTTRFSYDNANNMTRMSLLEQPSAGPTTTQSDTTYLFDEGGFNYERRSRLVDGSNGSNDPVTRFEFDFAGMVTKVTSLTGPTRAMRWTGWSRRVIWGSRVREARAGSGPRCRCWTRSGIGRGSV